MESLFARARGIELVDVTLPSGRVVQLRELRVIFGRATPDRLPEGALAASYTGKPLVSFDGAAMFGELALLRWLEVDGWQGAWLDTAHDRKAWREMPTRAHPVTLPQHAQTLYDAIVALNDGRASGAFSVMAWRSGQIIFVDYHDGGETMPRSRRRWMDAALDAGVAPADLLLATAAPQ